MPRARSIDPDALRFGRVVGLMRMMRGWTLVHLAKESGMNADWLGILESGRNIPSLTTIFRLAKAFGVEASELVRQVENLQRPDGEA